MGQKTRLALYVLVLLLPAVALTAQTATPRIIVDVVDAGGQLVPGATVTVTREGQAPLIGTTDEGGHATFADLRPTSYTVTAFLPGFLEAPPVTARLRDRGDTHVTARLGSPTFAETVTVGASAGAAAPEATIGKADLPDLPPDPDVLQSTIDALGGVGATVRVDGLTSGGLPPASTIQQIRIRQNSYDAEFHEATPTFVEIITNSKPVPWQRVVSLMDRAETLQARNAFNPDAPSAQAEGMYLNANGNLANRASVVFFGNYNGTKEDQPILAQTPSGAVHGLVNNPSHFAFSTLRVGLDNWKKQNLRIESDYQDQGSNNTGAGGFNLPERSYDREVRTVRVRGFWTEPFTSVINQVMRVQIQHQRETDTPASTAPATVVLNAFASGGAQFGGVRITDQVEWSDVVTAPIGKRQVWRGGWLLWHGGYNSTITSNAGGTYTFSSLQAFEAGMPATFTQRIGSGACCYGITQVGLWVQDDLAIAKTVNATVGLRQESESSTNGIVHLAPRGQVEWTPSANKRTTLRLGGGVFYGWLNPTDVEQTVRVDGVHQQDVLVVNPPYPSQFGNSAATALPSGRYLLAPNLQLPQTVRSSVGVDQAIGTWQLHADYAHAAGTHLFRGDNLNATDAFGARRDPQFANVIEVTSTGRMRSNTLSTSATYSDPKRGRFLRANYTFARADNDTDGAFFIPPDPAHPEADWGPSSQDVHHRFSGNGSLNLRRGLSLGTYWNYSSAAPYTITTGIDSNGDGIFNERPVGVGRNSARGFALFDQGIFVGWQWPRVTFAPEQPPHRRVQVGVSTTNVWNRVNRTVVSGVLTSPFFGQAVSATQPRRVYLVATTVF